MVPHRMDGFTISFITDGGLEMGMGHVYRSLTLAEEMRDMAKVTISFLTKSNNIVTQKISRVGFRVIQQENDDGIINEIKICKPCVLVVDRLYVTEQFLKGCGPLQEQK